jgi:UDP-N-acetylglucosamine 2-epimerase (non-hydrolysing)
MKILTIAGTRPELIRLSVIIEKLDILSTSGCLAHVFVYTNQNYDHSLSGQFFDEMNIRMPDHYFINKGGHSIGRFLASALVKFEDVILQEKPDKLLVLGDTNSGLLSIVAEKYKVPVYHMEAGSRCFDMKVPEESNRKIIDMLSTYNLPYTENSKQNLLSEGFHKNYVFKTGNPIYEVLNCYKEGIENSKILDKLELKEQNFVLVTAHRTENVDDLESLTNIIEAVNQISKKFKVIFSLHPRTKDKMNKFGLGVSGNVMLSKPFGFFDFVKLEKTAKCVISDSGTVQEECCIFNVPTITIRNSTERHETIECGSNILSGVLKDDIMTTFDILLDRKYMWNPPDDYLKENVSDTVINILLGR